MWPATIQATGDIPYGAIKVAAAIGTEAAIGFGLVDQTPLWTNGVAVGGIPPTAYGMYYSVSSNVYFVLDVDGGLFAFGDVSGAGNSSAIKIHDISKATEIINAIAFPSMPVFVPSDGDTVTIPDGVRGAYIDPAIPLTTLTVILPSAPMDGQEIMVKFGGTITDDFVSAGLTVSPNSGQTLIGALYVTAAPNTSIQAKYRAATSQWYIS